MTEPREERSRGGGRDFPAALQQLWWIPLVCAAVLGAGAFAVASLGARNYEATALLQVNNANLPEEIIGIGDTASAKPIQNVLAEIPPQVHQRSVAERAARSLDGNPSLTADQLLADTSASVDQQSGLINVKGSASAPDDAARIANALSRVYVDSRQAADLQRIHAARLELERIAKARAKSGSGDPTAASDLSALSNRIEQLRLTEQLRPASVALTSPATPPAGRSGISPWLAGCAGALLGLLIGLGIIALRGQADRRIYSPRDLERALGAPVLARIPVTRALRTRSPIARLTPREAEPFRLLLALLQHVPAAEGGPSVALTSASADEGKSTTAWYLAATAAAAGLRTVLLEADEARPSVISSNGEGTGGGLLALLLGRNLDEVVTPVKIDDGHQLDVVSARTQNGKLPLFDADDVGRTLERLREQYDLIVIETPPLPIGANAVPFVLAADSVIAVCRKGVVDRESAADLFETIEALRAPRPPLLGVAAIGFGRGSSYP